MDVERAEVIAAELDMLVRRRADKPPDPDELEPSYRESVRRHRERRRRANAAAWYEFYSRLADSHARISEYFEAKARALLLEDEGKER